MENGSQELQKQTKIVRKKKPKPRVKVQKASESGEKFGLAETQPVASRNKLLRKGETVDDGL